MKFKQAFPHCTITATTTGTDDDERVQFYHLKGIEMNTCPTTVQSDLYKNYSRAEQIEALKDIINEEIDRLRELRENEQDAERWLKLDEEIDALIIKRENSAAMIDAAWQAEAEAEHADWLDEQATIESVRP